jgi:hypothetical protein
MSPSIMSQVEYNYVVSQVQVVTITNNKTHHLGGGI